MHGLRAMTKYAASSVLLAQACFTMVHVITLQLTPRLHNLLLWYPTWKFSVCTPQWKEKWCYGQMFLQFQLYQWMVNTNMLLWVSYKYCLVITSKLPRHICLVKAKSRDHALVPGSNSALVIGEYRKVLSNSHATASLCISAVIYKNNKIWS